jgi:hypothetical protein
MHLANNKSLQALPKDLTPKRSHLRRKNAVQRRAQYQKVYTGVVSLLNTTQTASAQSHKYPLRNVQHLLYSNTGTTGEIPLVVNLKSRSAEHVS